MNCPNCGSENPKAANFCAQCGRALRPAARPRSFVEWLQGGVRPEGERRQVTILACDTVQSSLLAERMDPEEFLDLMNRAFSAILCPVFDYGGYLARLEGDGFKAFFGAPEAHDDDPLRAVRVGLEIQAAAQRIAADLEREGRASDFCVRVGVHTDRVVVGPVGADDTVEYTAMGIGIVLAARLESIAQPGTVLISESTYRLVEPYIEVVPLGPTQVKGRSQPVRVFEVTGLRTRTDLGEVRGVQSPLVGREVELAMLRKALARLLDSTQPAQRGSIVTLIGETGVGKSRLLRHRGFCATRPSRPTHNRYGCTGGRWRKARALMACWPICCGATWASEPTTGRATCGPSCGGAWPSCLPPFLLLLWNRSNQRSRHSSRTWPTCCHCI